MANTCIVYGKVLTLHRVSNSVAKLAKITARSNNKNYLNFSYMDFTTTQINSNFRIKVSGVNGEGKRLNTLVGVSGLLRLIGEKLANNLLTRAFKCMISAYANFVAGLKLHSTTNKHTSIWQIKLLRLRQS